MIRWFDHTVLKQPLQEIPTVRYYAMGAVQEAGAPGNEWRTAPDWPVAANETSFYLRDGGKLSTGQSDAASGGHRILQRSASSRRR